MIIRSLGTIGVAIESEKQILVMESDKDLDGAVVITNSDGKDIKTAEAHVINWPGEYEVSGWLIKAVETEDGKLVVQAQVEGVHIMHPGTASNLSDDVLDKFNDASILILPVSEGIRNASEAMKLGDSIEPRVIIPVGEMANDFIEKSGAQDVQAIAKATITAAGLPNDKTEIISLIAE